MISIPLGIFTNTLHAHLRHRWITQDYKYSTTNFIYLYVKYHHILTINIQRSHLRHHQTPTTWTSNTNNINIMIQNLEDGSWASWMKGVHESTHAYLRRKILDDWRRNFLEIGSSRLSNPSCFSLLVLLDDELWDDNRVVICLEAIYFVGLILGTCKEC